MSFESLQSFLHRSPPLADGFIPPHGGYKDCSPTRKPRWSMTPRSTSATASWTSAPHPRPDGAGRPLRQTEHPRRQPGQRHLQGDRDQAHERRPRQPEELLEDYRDFLRARGIEEWAQGPPVRPAPARTQPHPGANYETFRKGIEHPDPAICANVIVGLIKVTCYLLDQQIQRLEQDFLKDGGLRERMTRARLDERDKQRRRMP